jgi:hypothetical protein
MPSRKIRWKLPSKKTSTNSKEGRIENKTFELFLKPDAMPSVARERTIPFSMREKVEAEVSRQVDKGVLVEVSHTEWASPIVVVKKRDDSVRICGDFRNLNKCLEDDKYPLPNIEDLLAKLGPENKLFAKYDLEQAFNQIPLKEESQHLTTIVTSRGMYKYTVMPFGIKSAPSAFQRIMDGILCGLVGTFCYLDDILVAGRNAQELREKIGKVRQRLTDVGIKINESKSMEFVSTIEWLGYDISGAGIKPNEMKAKIIANLVRPKSTREVRERLGTINYYCKFIPNLSVIATPIYGLLKKDRHFHWGTDQEVAFEKVKAEFANLKAMALFNTDSRMAVRLSCDASNQGIGAVLEQEQPSGEYRPVLYWSSQLRKYERNYSISEKEALACVAACEKMKKYLLGRRFTLRTDHRALVYLLSQKSSKTTSSRVERWREKLSCFDYVVELVKGQNMGMADWLSRSPSTVDHEEHPLKEEFVINEVRSVLKKTGFAYAEAFKRLVVLVKSDGWDTESIRNYRDYWLVRKYLSVKDNLLFYKESRFIPCVEKRGEVIQKAHGAHHGRTRTGARLKETFWWPR